jgi:hypothetical protein
MRKVLACNKPIWQMLKRNLACLVGAGVPETLIPWGGSNSLPLMLNC